MICLMEVKCMDINNFTENELKLILQCIHVTLDLSLKCPDPKFYEDLESLNKVYDGFESITRKCESAIHI